MSVFKVIKYRMPAHELLGAATAGRRTLIQHRALSALPLTSTGGGIIGVQALGRYTHPKAVSPGMPFTRLDERKGCLRR